MGRGISGSQWISILTALIRGAVLFIEDEGVIQKILGHLGLREAKARRPPEASSYQFISSSNR